MIPATITRAPIAAIAPPTLAQIPKQIKIHPAIVVEIAVCFTSLSGSEILPRLCKVKAIDSSYNMKIERGRLF